MMTAGLRDLLLMLSFFGTAASAAAQGLVPVRELGVGLATEAANAAIADCTAKGYRVAVVVSDRAGNVKVVLRGDGAGPHLFDAARQKAYTAASSGSSTLTWAENIRQGLRAPDPNLVHLDGMLIIGGGLPIKAGDELVGAIGIAGAPGGDRDDACAKSGIAKIRDRLR